VCLLTFNLYYEEMFRYKDTFAPSHPKGMQGVGFKSKEVEF